MLAPEVFLQAYIAVLARLGAHELHLSLAESFVLIRFAALRRLAATWATWRKRCKSGHRELVKGSAMLILSPTTPRWIPQA